MNLQQLHEASLANQLTGMYEIDMWGASRKGVIINEPPTYFKKYQVLYMHKKGVQHTIAAFGPNPYEKVRKFVEEYFGISLDDYDFGVNSLIDDGRLKRKDPYFRANREKMFDKVNELLKRARV